MCAMALVHSRISRVYFLEPSADGGLVSNGVQIGYLKNLNHSFLTFQVALRSSPAGGSCSVEQPVSK
jgi:tRNA(Arg) A34 adenosine deaminase TadA